MFLARFIFQIYKTEERRTVDKCFALIILPAK